MRFLVCFTALFLTQSTFANVNPISGVGVSLGYNFASEIEVEFDDSQTYVSSGAVNFGARYAYPVWEGLGIMGGFIYEFNRDITEIQLDDTDVDTEDNFTVFLLEMNGYYHIYKGVFAYAGFNYTFPSAEFEADDTDMDGGIGFQIGAGYEFLPYLNADAGYRTENFVVTVDDEESSSARLWGFYLRLTFEWDFFAEGSTSSYDDIGDY